MTCPRHISGNGGTTNLSNLVSESVNHYAIRVTEALYGRTKGRKSSRRSLKKEETSRQKYIYTKQNGRADKRWMEARPGNSSLYTLQKPNAESKARCKMICSI